jgi:hypothetical protein
MSSQLERATGKERLTFRTSRLPEPATLAGYSALIDAFDLEVPLPGKLMAIGQRHRKATNNDWRTLTPRHLPNPTLAGHLTFALKYEGLDLGVLKKLFCAVGSEPIEALVRSTPTGSYARRIWFLYEWLLGKRLDLADVSQGSYVDVVDNSQQWAVEGERSPRHRVRDNLPGLPAFCPMVSRSSRLEEFAAAGLSAVAHEVTASIPGDILARTAAFLLLSDSKASFAIEGEQPAHDRIQRWGYAIGEAGKQPLTLSELVRLQTLVIGDPRFVNLGLRREGGFVGSHDRHSGSPLPEHISAKPEDLPLLLDGIIAYGHRSASGVDAVIASAALAFGFVYVHPFADGNGRIHRYLIHHVLNERAFSPPGMIFPVSAAILGRLDEYRTVLESYSRKLLPLIRWEPTEEGNVSVHNDTVDLYRYFDATPHAEFLYDCVKQTIEEDLPMETEYLVQYDAFRSRVQTIVDMPDRTLDLLSRFLRQGSGTLSGRARHGEFKALSDLEVERIEAEYRSTIGTVRTRGT